MNSCFNPNKKTLNLIELTHRFSFRLRHGQVLLVELDRQTMNGKFSVIHERVEVVDGIVVVGGKLVAAVHVLCDIETHAVHEKYERNLTTNK